MKELHFIISEKEKNRKCMDCTWFKTDPNDLPDFGKCIINHCDAISSDHACADFAYPKGGKGAKFMKGKANVICPKCKHCEGLDRLTKMYSCKHYNNYPDSAIGMDCEIECDNFEEVNMNKVKGKVSDWCPKCKNCKDMTRESNGVHDWLTEVECEDPYDGMTKTLQADSDICCSMFEPKPPCENCHGSNGTITISYKALFGEPVNCPSYEEKKEAHETKTSREIELEARITALLITVDNLQKDNKRLADKNKALFEENLDRLDKHTKQCQEIDNLRNEMISLKTINKGLAEDRKKLINYMRSLKIASENYLKEFTYEED